MGAVLDIYIMSSSDKTESGMLMNMTLLLCYACVMMLVTLWVYVVDNVVVE